ncbi:MAG: hypothetical protein ABI151_18390 [Chitinophagaceae bacterium]
MFKNDKLWIGIVLGLVAPVLAVVIYYFVTFYPKNVTVSEFIYYLKTYKSLLTGVSTISLVANAILFTIVINTRKDNIAKGLFVSTLVYGIAVLLIKLLR